MQRSERSGIHSSIALLICVAFLAGTACDPAIAQESRCGKHELRRAIRRVIEKKKEREKASAKKPFYTELHEGMNSETILVQFNQRLRLQNGILAPEDNTLQNEPSDLDQANSLLDEYSISEISSQCFPPMPAEEIEQGIPLEPSDVCHGFTLETAHLSDEDKVTFANALNALETVERAVFSAPYPAPPPVPPQQRSPRPPSTLPDEDTRSEAKTNLPKLNPYSGDKRRDLLTAAKRGDAEKVRVLLGENADVNTRHKDGKTVLIWAAIEGHAEIVKLLIHHGADLSAQDNEGKTAFIWAINQGHSETIELLDKAIKKNQL